MWLKLVITSFVILTVIFECYSDINVNFQWINNEWTCVTEKKHVILKNSEQYLNVINATYVNDARCNHENENVNYLSDILDKQNFKAKIDTTDAHEGKWMCKFYTHKDIFNTENEYATAEKRSNIEDKDGHTYLVISCMIDVHVRALRKGARCSVDRRELSFTLTESTVKDYDAVANSYFVDGQRVSICCHRPKQDYSISLKYMFNNTEFIDTTTSTNVICAQATLTSKEDGSILNYESKNQHSVVIYRVILRSVSENNYFRFKINGVIHDNVYYFTPSEKFYVVVEENYGAYFNCSMTDGTRHRMSNYLDSFSRLLEIDETTKSVLKCDVQGDSFSITFYPDTYFYYGRGNLQIMGLKNTNVKYKYIQNVNQIATKTIIYKYKENTMLNLTCISTGTSTDTAVHEEWIPSDLLNEVTDNALGGIINLTTEYDRAKVIYKLYDDNEAIDQWQIIFSLAENNPIIEEKLEEVKDDPVDEAITFKAKNMKWFIAAGATLIVLLIAIMAWAIRTTTKKQNIHTITDNSVINYETLPSHGSNRTLDHPQQWDIYSTTRDQVNDNSEYSVPYVPKNVEELYSEAIPKSKRKNPETNIEPAYAEVQFNQRVSKNVYRQTDDPNYAVVVGVDYANLPTASDQNYAEYANTFDNGLYANASTSGKKKK